MTDSDKLALKQNTAAIRCKLVVKKTDTLPEIVLTENDAVKNWTYSDNRYVPKQGFIGQFVARTLEGDLHNISDDFNIENREIELLIGVVDVGKNTTNWYSYGNFIVTNPEDNNVKDNTSFQAMDYTKLFNKQFDGDFTNGTYTKSYNETIKTTSVTALWLAKYTCAQVGVNFPQTSFTNSDFVINQNPFQAGESCRDVMKELSKLAYSWVRIGLDNNCYIDFEQKSNSTVTTYNTIDNNEYYTLETKKIPFGPINNVVVGMSGIDGESHSAKDSTSIAANGEHTLYIYDNPFTNTFELRELAQKKANKLFGLTYVQLETETIGHAWLQGTERINIIDMEGVSNFTYAFDKSINYSGYIHSTLSSMGDTEVESTLAYESDVLKDIRNASIKVDKQNAEIELLVKTTEQIEKEINPTGDAKGSMIYVDDASNNPLISLAIEGKSEQEVRSGKNIFDYVTNFSKSINGLTNTINQDGSITVSGVITAGYTVVVQDNALDDKLEDGETYTLSHSIVMGGKMYLEVRGTHKTTGEKVYYGVTSGSTSRTFVADKTNYKYVAHVVTSTIANWGTESLTFTCTFQIEKGSAKTSFEKFGKTPSPTIPSEINSVGYENLYDFDNNPFNQGYYNADGTIASNGDWKSTENFIDVKPNKMYSLSEGGGTSWSFYVIAFDKSYGFVKRIEFNMANYPNGFTFMTDFNVHHIKLQGHLSRITPEKIMLTETRTKNAYIPFGKSGIKVETVGKNILNLPESATLNGVTFTKNNDGTFNLSGTATEKAEFSMYVPIDESGIVNNEIYTLSKASNYNFRVQVAFYNGNTWVRTPLNLAPGSTLFVTNTINLSDITRVRYLVTVEKSTSINLSNVKIQLEKGTVATTIEPYQKPNASVIVLNAPLRGLPNDIKDVAYIKNNKLYVERNVGRILLDGTQTSFEVNVAKTNTTRIALYMFLTNEKLGTKSHAKLLCNQLQGDLVWDVDKEGVYINEDDIVFRINKSIIGTTKEEVIAYLSQNNLEITYRLATPYVEELGEIEIPSTFKKVTHIMTNDDLQPTIDVTYVKDTIIGDYVENHVTELKITENEIKESVQTVSSSVDGLNTSISRVEELTTDNSQVINVISTNIDRTSGEVREVTTTTGFTFNKDGMTIDDGSGFKAEHRANGTYYKDGTKVTGQYTKDGSKQKDLQLFGVYSYGMKDIDDTPMFVGQLYNDETGEECFGHFYNGG